MNLSCVVVTKNRPESLQRLLRSLAIQDLKPDEVVIVNDGGEALNPDSLGLKLVLVENRPGLGAARARNMGVARSQGKFILLMDDDVELVATDFISRARTKFDDPQVGLIFPRKIDVVGHRSQELSFFKASALTGELHGVKKDENVSDSVILGPMVTFIRRKAFEEVGGYDYVFGLGQGHSFREESDFQLRVQERGWKAVIEQDIFFKHHIQKSGGHGSGAFKKLFWIGHNQAVFGARHQKMWMPRAVLFAGIELPRYAWGSGHLMSYPAGLVGMTAGVVSSALDFIKSKRRRK